MKRGNKIQVVFDKEPPDPDLNVPVGNWAWIEQERAWQLIADGYGREWNPEADNLPDDLPGKQAFQEAGYNDLNVIKNLADWDAVPGIGQKTEEKLTEYFADE